MSSFELIQKFFDDYAGKIPEHELEILLEAAFHHEFPTIRRLQRPQLRSGESLPGSEWITQARIWAEKRIQAGVPLQHLTREQCFFGHYFEVGPEVLIPRPETEVLVERVLGWLRSFSGMALFGADLGTGSGVIPISLLLESAPGLRMLATESSPEALRRAQDNALRLGVESGIIWLAVEESSDVLGRVREWCDRGQRKLDFLVSNPPYLLRDATEVEAEVARFEPPQALFAPESDPLFYYRKIAEEASAVLRKGGRLFLEVPHERADQIQSLFFRRFENVEIHPDLTGKSRILEAELTAWTR